MQRLTAKLQHGKRYRKIDRRFRPQLSIAQILAWADAHHRRTGSWPRMTSGCIPRSLGENWRALDCCLRQGLRGLPKGSSLAKLLAERRGVRNLRDLPPLKRASILSWADAHYRRAGIWPGAESGPVAEAPGETWKAVDVALKQGFRGFSGGMSLARLLAEERGVRNRTAPPKLMQHQILAWADAHHRRTGRWPNSKAGPVLDAPGETWAGVDWALNGGARGLPGGISLAQLLAVQRGVRNRKRLPPFTVAQIRRWAEAHFRRTGAWPKATSGPIRDAPGETWTAVEVALRQGRRNLPGGSCLSRVLKPLKEGVS
jgi:hypothetical protein